jgi:uncharacterized protein (DUF58 family)
MSTSQDIPQTIDSTTAGTVAPSTPSASLVDPGTLMRIKNLQLRAKIVVDGFFHGLHRSPYHGFSVEFSEYRQYTPGDDLRYLDWRLYARSDRYYIKRFEDETNLRCHLLVDLSRSMGYGSLPYDKAEYARTLAATLAYFLAVQRDAVGLSTFDEQIVEYLPARFRPGHMHRLMLGLQRSVAGTSTRLAPPVEQLARLVNKRGVIVLISDLLAPVDSLEQNLGYLRSRGHEVIVMRILDPAEIDFQFDQASIFHDLESGRQLYVDPHAARESYLERFQRHADAIQETCSRLGIGQFLLRTDRPLEFALFDFLNGRMRRGKKTVRRNKPGQRQSAGGGAR